MYFNNCNLKALSPLLAVFLVFSSCQHKETDNVGTDNLQGSISISGAFALYPMPVAQPRHSPPGLMPFRRIWAEPQYMVIPEYPRL